MSPLPNRFLVLGASGFVGAEFLRSTGPDQAVGTYSDHPFPGGIRFDAQTDRVRDLLAATGNRFSHAIILMARARIDDCALDPAGTWLVNVRAAIDAIEDLQAAGILPVFASTDFVFDGRQGSYADDAPRTPVVTYGRQKAAVEAYCVASPKPSLVLRFSKVVGSSSASHNLIGEWLRAMEVGQTVRCAHDQRISPVGVEDLVIGIRKAAERGLTGVYNAGGPHGYSRLELVQVLSRKLLARGHTAPLVEPCSIRDFQFAEPRPLDTSLDSSALYRALEYRFRDMETYCEEVARLYTLNALSQPGVARDPSNEP